ncbi:DUF3592 domain-containing protein [Bordetella genomosp. 13]|uniref:DUF3592 domain-containing protein n=1 Tax=Bordetella genomosp. 13 TaxID=463040 RepID=A0A1W6ZH82_9BORD|nr:hypothetical protein [Bordetella genomosp. 13]ARP96706.1 hypothetical protein CAL15_21445 [Bordetella genomosp. 13]
MQTKNSPGSIVTDTGLSERTLRLILRIGCIGVPLVITVLAAGKDMPLWGYAIIWGVPLFMYMVMTQSMMPSAEERAAHALQHAPNTARGEATVTDVRHDGIMETENLRMTRLRLSLRMPSETGAPQQSEVVVKVEDALLSNFASGKTVHVLYDPADPRRVAVDRERSPLRVR